MKFPENFLLGAATAGHQVEGQNIYSNWWAAEAQGKVAASGLGADHFNKFDSDFALAKSLGLNAMRISIEWSRIEPQEGKLNAEVIAHYHDVFKSLRTHGLTPMVTLFHWTMPQWLAEKGGFESSFGVRTFEKYVEFIAREYGSDCNLWLTINEPEVFAFEGYWTAKHVPFRKNIFLTLKVYLNLIRAHKAAYKAIKKVLPGAQVGLAKNVAYHEPFRPGNWGDELIVKIGRYFGNEFFMNRLKRQLDFIGLNYYFTHTLKFSWRKGFEEMNKKFPKSDMGLKTYPKGLYHLLKRFAKYNKPLYVTENGIANATDEMRERFIAEHLEETKRALNEGAQVKGYFYWSLLDTYEWHMGYGLKFGLAEVNYETLERKPRVQENFFKTF